MKRFITILYFLTIAQFCFPQTASIEGHVHNINEDKGLAFAYVVLDGEKIVALTNDYGDFTIDSLSEGFHSLKITYFGYQDLTVDSIYVAHDTVINLYIEFPPPCKYDRKNKKCPVCHKKDKVIPIIYGLPSKGLVTESEKGKVRLGGCEVTGCDPHWYCKRDNKEF
ncbi:carboxypeptidase-like regulatory domain-containing protein [bacterium]|nr:carboxypeptidase-like regulatory domain-containing protein [bacterium]